MLGPLATAGAAAPSVLPFWRAAPDALAYGQDGQPLWPVPDDAAAEALGAVCANLGLAMRETAPAAMPDDAPLQRAGVVLGFRLADPGPAALYAHLSGRALRLVHTLEQVRAEDNLALLLTTTDALSLELVEALYNDRMDAPGLLFAPDCARLYAVARRFAAGLVAPLTLEPRQLVVAPGYATPELRERFEVIADVPGQAAQAQLRAALTANNGLLAVSARSDGTDAFFHANVVLCPFSAAPPAQAGRRPLCLELGRCTRYPDLPPLRVAHEERALLQVGQLRARLLLLQTCRGVRVQDDALDASFSLATALLEQSASACIVTSWSQMFDSQVQWLALVGAELDAGATIGQIVSSLNARRDGALLCAGLVLLGDPEVRAAARPGAPAAPPAPPMRRGTKPAAAPAPGPALEMLRAALHWNADYNMHADEAASAAMLQRLHGPADAVAPLDGEARAALLRLFAAMPDIEASWRGVQNRLCHIGRAVRCPACGGQCQLNRYESSIAGMDRYSLSCPRCEVVATAPVGCTPALRRATDGALILSGVAPGARALLNLVSRHFPYSRHWDWPLDQDGQLAARCALPAGADMPAGPLQCRVLISWDWHVAAVSLRMRGPDAVPATGPAPGAPPYQFMKTGE